MAGVKIVVDADGMDSGSPERAVASLVADGYSVHVLDEAGRLSAPSGASGAIPVDSAGGTCLADTVLLVSSPVLFSTGGVRYLRQMADVPGRVVTRVLVPGLESSRVALWSGTWVRERGLGLLDIARADAEFDRRWLSHDSPQARAWVPADDLGIVASHDVSVDVRKWARAQGRRLRLHRAYGWIRKRAGVVKRRASLWRQRRRMRSSAHKR